jgi:hypothetical protein
MPVTVTGFKKWCISYEMDGRAEEEKVQNAGNEHESMSNESVSQKTLKLRQTTGTVSTARLAKVN